MTMVGCFTFLALVAALAGFATFSAHAAIYCMILSFLFSGIVYYLLTATYLAMMLFVVYIGAVAMLFVFCVMLLNLSSRPRHTFGTSSYFFLFVYVALFFLISLASYSLGAVPAFDFFSADLGILAGETGWTPVSKDHLLTHVMYGSMLPVLVAIGLVLFYVTVLVTVLFSV